MKVCTTPGCPNIQPESKCRDCRRQAEQARGSSTQRGYGYTHTKLRAAYQRRMNAGEQFNCWRCSKPIDPTAWDLGHNDQYRTEYAGPECMTCNRGTAARR